MPPSKRWRESKGQQEVIDLDCNVIKKRSTLFDEFAHEEDGVEF